MALFCVVLVTFNPYMRRTVTAQGNPVSAPPVQAPESPAAVNEPAPASSGMMEFAPRNLYGPRLPEFAAHKPFGLVETALQLSEPAFEPALASVEPRSAGGL